VSAQEETENHWPGYVDALTTMTMILIFVMMVLSIAFFSASSNSSRRLIESIAEALGTKISGVGTSNDDVARQLVSEVERERARIAAEAARLAVIDAARTQPQENPGRIVESASAPPAPSVVAPVRADRGEAVLTLVFRARATAIDQQAREALALVASEQQAASSEVALHLVAYASAAHGALSDSRRVAYYRAMATRAELIARGIPAPRLTIRIEDRDGEPDRDRVRLFVRPPPSAGRASPNPG
jgi:hypothetical protein